jgi:hypothetical protein
MECFSCGEPICYENECPNMQAHAKLSEGERKNKQTQRLLEDDTSAQCALISSSEKAETLKQKKAMLTMTPES